MSRNLLIVCGVVLGVVVAPIAFITITKNVEPSKVLVSREDSKSLHDFIARESNSQDVAVQDKVTNAKMKLAYMASYENPDDARRQFLDAEQTHRGTEAMDPAFGTQIDQAKYQAINCLLLEGKQDQAKSEYFEFLKNRPLSPLVHAVHKRILSLSTDEESREKANRLLQQAIDAQAEYVQKELTICGPRCISRLLELEKQEPVDAEKIAVAAQTSEKGTTMTGMSRALKEFGFESRGKLVNQEDFRKGDLPFLWLNQDHYVLVHSRNGSTLNFYDPLIKNDRSIDTSKLDNQFSATILTIQKSKLTGDKP